MQTRRALAALGLAVTVAAAAPAADRFSPLSMGIYQAAPQVQGFGAMHAATAMGIPTEVTRDLMGALHHPFVVVAGSLHDLSAENLADLHLWIHAGGTLVIDDLDSAPAQELADVTPQQPSIDRTDIVSNGATVPVHGLPTVALHGRGDHDDVIARFDDGAVAIARHTDGWGHVMSLGARWDDLVLHPPESPATPPDVMPFMLRAWYQVDVPGSAWLSPAPAGLDGILVVTHDVASPAAAQAILPVAREEKTQQALTTWFVASDVLTPHVRRVLQQVDHMGQDVGCLDPHPDSLQALKETLPKATIDSERGAPTQAGFRNDSSLPVTSTMLPYRRMQDGSVEQESDMTEFPILITDRTTLADAHRLVDLADHREGVAVLSITPTPSHLEFEKALLAQAKGHLALWSIRDVAAWWRVRQQTRLEVLPRGDTWIVRVFSPQDIIALTVEFGSPRRLVGGKNGKDVFQAGPTRVVMPLVPGGRMLEFVVSAP